MLSLDSVTTPLDTAALPSISVKSTTMDGLSQSGLLSRVRGVKVLVVGDLMLDIYRVGLATRISPEAPVPVLLNPVTEFRLGGAAAVGAMCAALGAEVCVLGVVGDDSHGAEILRLLNEASVQFIGEVSASRVTTAKERICGVSGGRHRQQLGRIDCEDGSALPPELVRNLCETLAGISVDPPDVVLVSDYAKGVVSHSVATVCRDLCGLVIADPARGGDWDKYQYYSCLVPNREEAVGKSAAEIRRSLKLQAAIVKLDQDGCEVDIAESNGRPRPLAARCRVVHDVTGAGDQFLAVLGCVKGIGGSWYEAAELANAAAGLQVERHGCVPIMLDELIAATLPALATGELRVSNCLERIA